MNYKNENMDEEKSFEVIQEGEQKEFEQPPPHLVKRGLTEVSAMFDRNGKGYLDDTERALRRMDSADKGFLGIDKVCVIFESLQSEQERSSHLLEALRTESKKSLNLKKGVIALSCFTILLALANIGTSFAVATLVKDMQVSTTGDLMSKIDSNVRVGTTSKVVSFEMQSLDEGRRRRLQSTAGLVCETMVSTDADGTTEKQCALQGTITADVADIIHDQLVSIDYIQLKCNGESSLIYGTYKLPSGSPGDFPMGSVTYKVYPTVNDTNKKYSAVQEVYTPAQAYVAYDPGQPYIPATDGQPEQQYIPEQAAIPYQPAGKCDAYFELAMYCPKDLVNGVEQQCLVMSAFMPTESCNVSPTVCGPAPVTTSNLA